MANDFKNPKSHFQNLTKFEQIPQIILSFPILNNNMELPSMVESIPCFPLWILTCSQVLNRQRDCKTYREPFYQFIIKIFKNKGSLKRALQWKHQEQYLHKDDGMTTWLNLDPSFHIKQPSWAYIFELITLTLLHVLSIHSIKIRDGLWLLLHYDNTLILNILNVFFTLAPTCTPRT